MSDYFFLFFFFLAVVLQCGKSSFFIVLRITSICTCVFIYLAAKETQKRVIFKLIENKIQSTLVISKSKGPSETLRDIRTSTYQI